MLVANKKDELVEVIDPQGQVLVRQAGWREVTGGEADRYFAGLSYEDTSLAAKQHRAKETGVDEALAKLEEVPTHTDSSAQPGTPWAQTTDQTAAAALAADHVSGSDETPVSQDSSKSDDQTDAKQTDGVHAVPIAGSKDQTPAEAQETAEDGAGVPEADKTKNQKK